MNFKNMNLNDHPFKSSRYNWGSTYTNLMEITNQKRVIDIRKKKRKEVKPTTKKSSNHNGKKKNEQRKQKTRKTRNKRAIRTLFFSC